MTLSSTHHRQERSIQQCQNTSIQDTPADWRHPISNPDAGSALAPYPLSRADKPDPDYFETAVQPADHWSEAAVHSPLRQELSVLSVETCA